MDPAIGFIGLGEMGLGMAINAAKAGFNLTVFDLRKEHMDRVVSHGASQAESVKNLAEKCSWIFLSLPGTNEVNSVISGPDGLSEYLESGSIVIDCGTTHPLTTIEIAEDLKKKDVIFLDAPVSGMHTRALEGTLTAMVGGEEAAFKKVEDVMSSFANKILYMGKSGNGQLTKLTNQLLFNISAAAIAEILPMAVKMGLDPAKVIDVVKTGTGRSLALEFFGPLILKNDFGPGYPLQNAYKDMISAAEISSRETIPLPVTSAATWTYQLALKQGLGKENKGAMIKVWEQVLGVKVREKK